MEKIKDREKRLWYANECFKNGWSKAMLIHQIELKLYERRILSNKFTNFNEKIELKGDSELANEIIKDPYIFELEGLNKNYVEKELEEHMITRIRDVLLELGRGFSFVERQKRISFDGRHFYIDLVFYNYILKCFVLFELKTGDLTHQDIGQLQMYVNYYTRELMNEGDNKPIGILLCADKSDSIVKYTLPEENNQIFASKYQLYLPSEEELKKELENGCRILEDMKIES